MVVLLLQTVSGQQLEVSVDSEYHLADVRLEVAEQWGVPELLQCFSFSGKLLNDDQPVEEQVLALVSSNNYCSLDDEPLLVDFVQSFNTDAIVSAIHSPDRNDKEAALQAIHILGASYAPEIAALLAQRTALVLGGKKKYILVQDLKLPLFRDTVPDWNLWLSVFQLLLAHHDAAVRFASVRVLSVVAGRGDREALSLIVSLLDDENPAVRQGVMLAIPLVAEKRDYLTIALIGSHMEDEDENVRCAALDALKQVATRGNVCSIELIAARLEDEAPLVRCCALDALAVLSETNSPRALELTAARLQDTDSQVQAVALEALPAFTERGNRAAIDLIMGCLCDEEQKVCVRLRAAETLREVAQEHDHRVINMLIEVMTLDTNGGVAKAALHSKIALCGG